MRRALTAVLMLASGCAVGPDYRRPEVIPVERFRAEPQTAPAPITLGDLPWWTLFGDPVLQTLLREAVAQNLDAQRAAARVEEARALSGATWWSLFPTLGATVDARRQRTTVGATEKVAFDLFSAQANVAWELDVWGRLRRTHEAARARFTASEEVRRDVLTAVVAEVAQTYFALRSLDAQCAITRQQRDARQTSLEIFEARLKGGTGNLAEVASAQALVLGAEAEEERLQRERQQTENALSVLLGRPPGAIARGTTLEEQTLPPAVPAGFPAELLNRRPDVRAAEQALIAANADVGAALGRLYPVVKLSGTVGLLTPDLADPLRGGPVWSFGASAPWTLPFLGGDPLRADYQAARSRYQQVLAAYEQTVLVALREVSDALVARERLERQTKLLEQQVLAVEKQQEMALFRYQAGVANYLEVTSAEERLLPVKLALAQSRANLLSAIVQLYRALGGGWEQPQDAGDRARPGRGGAEIEPRRAAPAEARPR